MTIRRGLGRLLQLAEPTPLFSCLPRPGRLGPASDSPAPPRPPRCLEPRRPRLLADLARGRHDIDAISRPCRCAAAADVASMHGFHDQRQSRPQPLRSS